MPQENLLLPFEACFRVLYPCLVLEAHVSYPQGVEPSHNCFGLATGLGISVIGGPFSHEN